MSSINKSLLYAGSSIFYVILGYSPLSYSLLLDVKPFASSDRTFQKLRFQLCSDHESKAIRHSQRDSDGSFSISDISTPVPISTPNSGKIVNSSTNGKNLVRNMSSKELNGFLLNLGRRGDWMKVLSLLDEADKYNSPMDIRCYGAAITAFARAKQPQHAVGVLDRMEKRNMSPNLITYSSVIDAFAKVGDSNNALKYLSIIENAPSIFPDVKTYSTVMTALARNGKINDAVLLLERMKKNGVAPNVVTYTTIIDGFAKTGNAVEALKYMKEMINTENLLADVQVYNTLISSLARSMNPTHAIVVLESMRLKGIEPDLFTYNAVLDAFSKCSDHQNAIKYLTVMESNGIKPDVFSYSIAMKACVNSGKFRKCTQLYQEMCSKEILPDESSLFICIGACVRSTPKGKGMQEAFRIVIEEISYKNINFIMPYTMLIESCCRSYDKVVALQVYRTMKERKVEPDLKTRLLLMKLFGEQDQSKSATDMLSEMQLNKNTNAKNNF